MESEIRFGALSSRADFPIVVPTAMFADYHRESGTGVLITERIPFGADGIEPQYEKCMDYEMPDQLGHYRALLTAVATLAGTQKAGRLRCSSSAFTTDIEQLSVGERHPAHGRQTRLVAWTGSRISRRRIQRCCPPTSRSPRFLTRLRAELPRLLDARAARLASSSRTARLRRAVPLERQRRQRMVLARRRRRRCAAG